MLCKDLTYDEITQLLEEYNLEIIDEDKVLKKAIYNGPGRKDRYNMHEAFGKKVKKWDYPENKTKFNSSASYPISILKFEEKNSPIIWDYCVHYLFDINNYEYYISYSFDDKWYTNPHKNYNICISNIDVNDLKNEITKMFYKIKAYNDYEQDLFNEALKKTNEYCKKYNLDSCYNNYNDPDDRYKDDGSGNKINPFKNYIGKRLELCNYNGHSNTDHNSITVNSEDCVVITTKETSYVMDSNFNEEDKKELIKLANAFFDKIVSINKGKVFIRSPKNGKYHERNNNG